MTVSTRAVLLEVLPRTSRIDEPVRFTITGAAPGAPVELRVCTVDGSYREWVSTATFTVPPGGVVDTATQAPVNGYPGVDPLGPLWSMRPAEGKPEVFFSRRTPRPLTYTATAVAGDDESAEVEFVRTFGCDARPGVPAPPGSGVAGTYFRPARGGPAPGVLVVGGSDGGEHPHAAALLAEHGHAVLSLAYFGVEDRPQHLTHIDLGYFETALGWLADQPEVDPARLAVIGLSRGGELALQLGALLPQLRAVVAGAPSSVRQAGLASSYTDFTQPAWELGGESLPFIPGKYGPREFLGFTGRWLLRRPVRQRPLFERMLRNEAVAAAAAIEVERIAGPVLLLSGGDDQLWPSTRYADRIAARLRARGRPCRQVDYPDAGHFVCFPYNLPSLPPMTRLSPTAGLTIDFGGTPQGNARAATASWAEILTFLDDLSVAAP